MEVVTDQTPKPTPLQQLQAKYAELCAQLGEQYYKKNILEQEIHKLTNQLRDVNEKGFKLAQKAEAEAAGKPEESPQTEAEETPAHEEGIQDGSA